MWHGEEHSCISLLFGTIHVATGSFRNITKTRQRLFIIKSGIIVCKNISVIKDKGKLLRNFHHKGHQRDYVKCDPNESYTRWKAMA